MNTPRKHTHRPHFVMGHYPVAAVCREAGCTHRLIANGGGWVSRSQAQKLLREAGVR